MHCNCSIMKKKRHFFEFSAQTNRYLPMYQTQYKINSLCFTQNIDKQANKSNSYFVIFFLKMSG